MEKVLVVAKTHMNAGYVCIGGLNLGTRKNVRLLLPGLGNRNENHPANTPFDVGQIWNLELQPRAQAEPPHVEDMIIIDQKQIGRQSDIRQTLLQYVKPWQGDYKQLFDGCLEFTDRSGYISRQGEMPSCSTGYWLTSTPLIRKSYKDDKGNEAAFYHPQIQFNGRLVSSTLRIKYVGFVNSIERIPENTLIRVSLARWFPHKDYPNDHCYLQISGWYL
jgi:hypothetical protein